MNKLTEKQRVLTLISKGYVLPLDIYPPETIKEIMESTFTYEGKDTAVVKSFTLSISNILRAELNHNFELEQ